MDSDENVYLVSRGKVSRFGEEGKPGKEYYLGGDACFFLENAEGGAACVAMTGKGVTLYDLGIDGAEEQWELEVSALCPVGLISVGGNVSTRSIYWRI